MLIRFESDIAGQFIMMGDVALPLLRMMGMSGNEQGAVSGADLLTALATLEEALRRVPVPRAGADEEDEDQEPPITLQRRALPLLEMLRRAAADEGYVMWQPD
jgi:hypothetical protein